MKKNILFFVFVICFVSYLNALTTTWTGAASGDWHNPDNWDTGVIPDASTDVYVPAATSTLNSPAVSTNAPCANISNHGSLTVYNGASLNVQNNYTGDPGESLDISGGSLNAGGNVEVYGTVNVEGDGVNDGSISCTNFNASSSSTTTLENDGELSSTHLNDNGSIVENGGEIACDDFAVGNGGVINQSGGSLVANSGGTFDTGSALSISGNGSFRFDGDVNFNGSATIDGNSILWAGGSSDPNFIGGVTSQVTVNSGYFSIGDFSTSGTVNIQGGGTYWNDTTIDGNLIVSSGELDVIGPYINNATFNQTGGTANFNGDFTLSSSSTNTQSGGTLNLKGDASISSSIINTGSTGDFVFNGGRIQSVTNPTAFPNTNIVPNLKVNNNSTVIFDEKTSFAAGNVEVNSGTLNIGPGLLEPTNPGMGTWAVGANSEIILGGNNTLPNYGTKTFDPSSKVTYNSNTYSQPVEGINYPTLELSGTSKTLNGNASVSQEIILNTILDIGNYDFTLLSGADLTHSSNCFFATTGSGYLKRNNISSGSFPIGASVSYPNGFSFDNNGTALISIGARVETGITPTHPNAGYCLQRTWDIIKEGTLYADFTFFWLQTQEIQPFEQARVNSTIVGQLCHTPPSWQVISTPSGATGTGIIGDPYRVDIGPIAMVSAFALGDGDHTLPVQLSAFDAVYSNEGGMEFVQVNWSTATETDVLGFNVYKSITEEFDDAMKINAGLIQGQGTTTVGHSYSFDDLDADVSLRNYYWIEQTDFSGLSELFGPAVFIPEGGGDPNNDIYSETIVLQQFPNPVENNMKIEYQIKGSILEQDAIIHIYNMKGEFIDTVFGHSGAAEIDLSRYATGVYFYRLQDTSLGETYKFVVIR